MMGETVVSSKVPPEIEAITPHRLTEGSVMIDAPKLRAAVKAYSDLLEEADRLRSALQGLSDMYVHAWDLSDGGLVMMESSIPKFEAAHKAADKALHPQHGVGKE